MEQATRRPLHPLLVVAAIAVIVFSVVGVAAITGLIPASRGTSQSVIEQPISAPLDNASPSMPADEPVHPRTVAPPVPNKPRPATMVQSSPARKPAAVPEQREPTHTESPPVYAPAAMPEQREPTRVAIEQPRAAPPAPVCLDCGVIESVREVQAPGEGSGVGAVAGGVAGAVLGRQVGGGRGRDLATVVGAVGGAVAGHQIEKRVRTNSSYQITVRMDDGSVRSFTETAQPTWRTGDRVRIQGDRLTTEG